MFHVFDHPWGLLTVAIVTLLILAIVRSIRSMEYRWWQFVLVALLSVAFLVFNYIIETDLVRINKTTAVCVQAVIILTIAGLLILQLVRAVQLDKRYWRLWLLPILLASAALALDWFVKTDLEKIKELLNAGIEAVEAENADTVAAVISPDYNDSYHNAKEDLMYYCRQMLSEPLVKRIKKTGLLIEISPPEATATLNAVTKFDERSFVYEFKTFMLVKMELYLQKQPDRSWLINRAEVLKVDNRSVDWRTIR